MKGWRLAAAAAALTAAAGLGAALAPPTKAQTTVRAQSPRAVQIVSGGSRIGVTVHDIEDGDTKGKQTAGVIVEEVAPDGPAAKAGIRKGDAIVEFDGERVRSARQLTRLVQETPAGRSVNAVLARDGQRTTVTVTPSDSDGFSFDFDNFDEVRDLAQNFRYRIAPRAAVPPARPIPPTPPPPPPGVWTFDGLLGRSSRLGVTLDSLSSQLAEYFGTKRGVLVTSVYDDSAAAKAGLKAGDVITSFNGSAVDGPADVRRMIQDLQEDAEFTIEVMRDRKPVTLKGKMERTERRRSTSRTIL
jgi:serine protease Do